MNDLNDILGSTPSNNVLDIDLFGDLSNELEIETDELKTSSELSHSYEDGLNNLITKINNRHAEFISLTKDVLENNIQNEWSYKYKEFVDIVKEYRNTQDFNKLTERAKRQLHTGKNIFLKKIPRVGEFLHGIEDLFSKIVSKGDIENFVTFLSDQVFKINHYVTNIIQNNAHKIAFEIDLTPFEIDEEELLQTSEEEQEHIRIPLADLNTIISENDYIKIVSSRIRDDLDSFNGLLKELSANLIGLSEIIKSLEDYSDKSIKSTNKGGSSNTKGFDPLEMDVYTELQDSVNMIKGRRDDFEATFKEMSKRYFSLELGYKQINDKQEDTLGTLQSFRLINVKEYGKRIKNEIKDALRNTPKDTKIVELEFLDNGVRIDRGIMNNVMGAFGHLLRNSVDHGIETKIERRAKGKPEHGTITINSTQGKNGVTFNISDDGAGLNLAKIKSKAIEKGLIGSSQELTKQETINLILKPGFSTADKISDTSGRGVGLDAVKDDILSLNGTFSIHSEEGKGTTFEIYIPTKYVNSYGLIVEGGDNKFIVPTDIISEIVLCTKDGVNTSLKNGYILHKDQNIPLVTLNKLLRLKSHLVENDYYHVVILKSGDETLALVPNEIGEVREINIKTPPYYFNKYKGIIGFTILSDGNSSYIIDPIQLKNQFSTTIKQEQIEINETPVPYILIVDDSTVIRRKSEKFCKERGYKYDSAKSGSEAIRKIAEKIPDIILLDIEMGGMDEVKEMNGFDVAQHIKENDDIRYQSINIFMITSRAAQKHRDKAKELGVDEYLIKPFQEKELEGLITSYFSRKIKY